MGGPLGCISWGPWVLPRGSHWETGYWRRVEERTWGIYSQPLFTWRASPLSPLPPTAPHGCMSSTGNLLVYLLLAIFRCLLKNYGWASLQWKTSDVFSDASPCMCLLLFPPCLSVSFSLYTQMPPYPWHLASPNASCVSQAYPKGSRS